MRYVCWLITVLMTVTGCMDVVNTEPDSPPKEVGYAVARYASETKADTKMDSTKSFKVFGIYTGADDFDPLNLYDAVDYIPGVEISCINGQWRNKDKTYYWPKSGKLSFTAYSPANANLVYDRSEIMFRKEDYDVSVQEDLLIADLTSNMEMTNGAVPILFRHALSQINIRAKTSVLKEKGLEFEITLNRIVITGTSQVADFSWTTDNTMHWTDHATPIDCVLNDRSMVLDTSEVKTYVSGHYTIPQYLMDASMVIDFELVTKTGDTILERVDLESSVSFDDISQWRAGMSYTYTVIISPVSRDIIAFDPSVTDWKNDDSKNNI